jgi:hypothetical protein
MLAVSSREKAEHNIELLWRDRQLVNLQKNAVEEVIRELSKEGLENLAINPPKPIQKVLETLINALDAEANQSTEKNTANNAEQESQQKHGR